MKKKYERLLEGETFVTKERGNSMIPLIRSGQIHTLEPATWEDCKVGDIVYAKIKGNFYTHIVKQICQNRGCLIGNNHGKINGWTKNIYGKVIKIF